jgi:hypothetical protein
MSMSMSARHGKTIVTRNEHHAKANMVVSPLGLEPQTKG